MHTNVKGASNAKGALNVKGVLNVKCVLVKGIYKCEECIQMRRVYLDVKGVYVYMRMCKQKGPLVISLSNARFGNVRLPLLHCRR